MTAPGGRTSRVETALSGRIGTRDEVRGHLRAIEADARALRDEIEVVLLTGGSDDAPLRAAADELGRVLGDAPGSLLSRALARGPGGLEPGKPGRRSLDNRWRAVRRRAEGALERYEHAAAFRKTLARLHARFGERLPWHLAQALLRAGIADRDADRPDAASLRARVERLNRIEAELEGVSTEVPLRAAAPLDVADWPEGVSPEELAAALEAAEREDAAEPGGWRNRTRRMAGAHASRLLGTAAAGTRRDAAEALAREVTQLVEAGVRPGAEDVDAWGIVLRAAARDRGPVAGVSETSAAAPETGSLLFVVPLFGPYVLVRTGRPRPARVEGRAVRCGERARVIAALPPGSTGTALPPERWAAALFDLPEDPSAEWMATTRPAKIVPFARIAADRWLATVEARGRLDAAGAAAWQEAPRGRGGWLRLLPSVDVVPAEGFLPAGPPQGTASGAFGWRTDTVPVPVADVPTAWLRTAVSPAGGEHLEREQAFFQAAGLCLPGRAPRCLGRPADGRDGYLYAPPLAFRGADSAPLRAWERDDPLVFVTAAAKLWLAFRERGLALGFYHPETLGFRALFGRRDAAEPPLEAVALAAPLGTRLGATYRRSRETLGVFPAYERLGPRLPPAQLEGEVAMPETEARAFALYALDRLLTAPLEIPPGAPWDEFVDVVANPRVLFSAPFTAEGLIVGLRRGAQIVSVVESISDATLPSLFAE
jgi:hypothetical protein